MCHNNVEISIRQSKAQKKKQVNTFKLSMNYIVFQFPYPWGSCQRSYQTSFDNSDIPKGIKNTFEEVEQLQLHNWDLGTLAISCFMGCWKENGNEIILISPGRVAIWYLYGCAKLMIENYIRRWWCPLHLSIHSTE